MVILLKRSDRTVEGVQKDGLATGIIADDKVDRSEPVPPDVSERTEVREG